MTRDYTSDWKTAPADVTSAGPGDGSTWEMYEDEEEDEESMLCMDDICRNAVGVLEI